MNRVMWIVALLAAGCQPTLLPPDALQGTDGRLFDEDNAAAREIADSLAHDHVESKADRFFAGLPNGLAITRDVRIVGGKAHVRLDQEVDGVPVFGAQTIVHLGPDGVVERLTDGWERDLRVDTVPTVKAHEAIDLVEDREGPSIDDPEADLFVMRHQGRDHLVWRVRLTQLDGTARSAMPVVFVDAHTGKVVRRYDDLQTTTAHVTTPYNGGVDIPVQQVGSSWHLRSDSANIGTYTLGGSSPGYLSSSVLGDITASSSTGFTDGVALDAHYGADRTMTYFADVHGRNGIDGYGGPNLNDGVTVSAVHYGSNYVNAFWNGSAMVYGDGDGWQSGPLTALDIAAHEMTHGVTAKTAGLVYQGESGALNEAMSDIFAALVEHHNGASNGDAWKIGEDAWTPNTSGDALRYMNDPTADFSSRDHYASRYTGASDNGGVHWNSGIANLAFHLLVEGGTHPTPSRSLGPVQGIGFTAAGAIFYSALTDYMGPSTDFFGARTATLSAAADLYGANSTEWTSVANAWAEVGVGERVDAADNNGPTDPVDPGNTELAVLLDQSGLAAGKGEQVDATFEVPEGATSLTVRLSGGTGDGDLYVRHGSAPTTQSYDCRPYKSGNDELCTFDAPAAGTWHVAVIGYAAFAGSALHAEAIVPAEVPTPVPTETAGLDEAIDGAKGDELRFAVDVGAGATKLVVTLSGGTGDGDLYVKQGSTVSQSTWDCRPYRNGNEETCTVDAPAEGTWSIMVHAYADVAGATLTATVE